MPKKEQEQQQAPHMPTAPKLDISVEDMTPEEQEAFLKEPASRQEVSMFIMNYMQNQCMPYLMAFMENRIKGLVMTVSVLQAMLVDAGVATEEQIKELVASFRQEAEKQPDAPPSEPMDSKDIEVVK